MRCFSCAGLGIYEHSPFIHKENKMKRVFFIILFLLLPVLCDADEPAIQPQKIQIDVVRKESPEIDKYIKENNLDPDVAILGVVLVGDSYKLTKILLGDPDKENISNFGRDVYVNCRWYAKDGKKSINVHSINDRIDRIIPEGFSLPEYEKYQNLGKMIKKHAMEKFELRLKQAMEKAELLELEAWQKKRDAIVGNILKNRTWKYGKLEYQGVFKEMDDFGQILVKNPDKGDNDKGQKIKFTLLSDCDKLALCLYFEKEQIPLKSNVAITNESGKRVNCDVVITSKRKMELVTKDENYQITDGHVENGVFVTSQDKKFKFVNKKQLDTIAPFAEVVRSYAFQKLENDKNDRHLAFPSLSCELLE